MDLLLTHGYFLNEDPGEEEVMRPYPPLGLLYLSSYLKRVGFQIKIFDSTFRSREDFRNFLENHPPPVVGIYSNMLTRASVIRMIDMCRERAISVIVGGPDPANYAERYLQSGASVVVIGEGEKTLEDLLQAGITEGLSVGTLRTIPGIAFLEGARLIMTPGREKIRNLDSLPFPDRDGIQLEAYLRCWRRNHGYSAVSLITSRGCPYTCKWCSHSVFGYSYRSRSPANVADEVEEILDRYQPDTLWYADDVFTMNHRWLVQFAAALDDRDLTIPFETITREDRLDRDVIQTLSRMGCRRIWIGSESGSQKILDAMSRRTDAGRVREMVHQLKESGIETGMFIMLGYEGETLEDLKQTARHIEKARPDKLLTTLAYPIRGTPYFDEVADRVVTSRAWAESSDQDLTVRGRRSARFYEFASRWLSSIHRLDRLRDTGTGSTFARLRAWSSALVGRVGMAWTRSERIES